MSIPLNPEAMLPAGFVAFTHEGVLLGYDPLTGRGMKWNINAGRSGKAHQWTPITPGTTRGRTQVQINSSKQLWHRIIAQHFLNGGGPIPTGLAVDHREHVDGTAAQDRLANLRIVTTRENGQNLKPRSSQYAGVYWHKRKSKWESGVKDPLTRKRQYLGYFTDERKAASAYIDYCIQHNLPHAPALERFAAA